MNNLAIQITNLSKRYPTLVAVESLNLEVKQGEIFGFLGPNGAGKSTTLRMLLSLIKPSSGNIEVFGKSLLQNREVALSNIGCIIEKPDFYLYMTAAQNLKMLARLNDVKNTEQRIKEVIELVGLQGRQNDKVQTYSHGMKQRLGLAQALLHNPLLIILDEPTTGLDPQGIIELRYLLLRLKNEFGKTVVLSSHILSEVELIADSMVIMNKGKAVAQGSVKQLLSSENLIVKIETDDVQKVKSILNETFYANAIERTDPQSISLKLSRSQIPDLNTLLTQQSVHIFGISYQRPLEEYFLKITQAGDVHA
jgi:ABC-type multidrug transport system ATPase subunit